ncbi:cobalamin biosynthesis protein CobT [Xenorhabdus sp. KJ12.1]|uniref:cobaltochelatase CobT-related protein n=1 Tax=Xenorhabdus sp. KJ12.1 TaxID=1851571 RepID=UPI000C03DFBB|nr:cobalamin biosynthesis protein CobT [Xenorhabdus sp. KJ12.1]PHM69553.1 VWA domain-containing protein [Xenorhabdus sp. KJ12.1]
MIKDGKIRPEVLTFRESVQTVVSLLASKKIKVVDFGSQAYCAYNKKTGELEYINIPSIPDTASDTLLNAIRGFIDHEVAHVLFTDHKISTFLSEKKAHYVWNVIEDTYIERKMSSIFQGSRQNLLKTQKYIIENYFSSKIDGYIHSYAENTRALFLEVFLMPISRAFCGHTPFMDFMESYWDMFESELAVLDSINYKVRINRITKSEGSAKLAADLLRAFRLDEKKTKKEKIEEPSKTEASKELESTEEDLDHKVSKTKKDKKIIKKEPHSSDKEDTYPDTDTDKKTENNDIPKDNEDTKDSKNAHSDELREPELNDGSESKPTIDDRESKNNSNSGDESKKIDTTIGGDSPSSELDTGDTVNSSEPELLSDSEEPEKLTAEDMAELESDDAPKSKSVEDAASEMISDEIKSVHSGAYLPLTRVNDFMGLLENASEFIKNGTKRVGGAVWADSSHIYYEFNEKLGLSSFRKFIEPQLTNKSQTLSKDLERAIASKNRVQKVNGLRKGKINSSSLWKIALPTINDDRVFSRKYDHKAVNAAVQLVIDLSGSMGGKRIMLATAAAYALSDALDKIKVPNIITGFTTVGLMRGSDISCNRYEPLFLPTLKNWNEKVNSSIAMARLGTCVSYIPLCNNVDGESILSLSRHHVGRTEDKQIMLILSDGAPCAKGNGFGKHLVDSADYLINKAKIDLLAIGIQTSDPEKFYKYHTKVNSVDDLPKTVIAAIRNVLLGNVIAL